MIRDTSKMSRMELFKLRPLAERQVFLASLSDEEVLNLAYDWSMHARPTQIIPKGDWFVWLVMSGRGFGKTRVLAETVRYYVENNIYGHIGLIAANAADARDVIVEGESGILATAHPKNRPIYNPSNRKITWENGAIAHLYSGESPEVLRGPQHSIVFIDELAKMPYQQEVWDQTMFGLRLHGRNGEDPRCIVTTTPRPTPLMKEIIKDEHTIVTTGSTFDNASNLSRVALAQMKKRYEGTRLGQQELYAVMLEDNPNALFNRDNINANKGVDFPDMKRIVVAIDPAVTNNEHSDETGIIVAGRGVDDHGYIFHDGSIMASPNVWAKVAIDLYDKYQGDSIIGENNQGGDMIETIILNLNNFINYTGVRATRGKVLRAEPISALYERNLIHHAHGMEELETQMCDFDPTIKVQKSPDRLDALVWALTDLFGDMMTEVKVWAL